MDSRTPAIADHGCNALCRDGRHCDLVYTGAGDAAYVRWAIAAQYGRLYGVRVTEVQAAREAPPLAAQAPPTLRDLGAPARVDAARWLVWWEEGASR